jgi:molybdopterin converting factor small subunit
MIGGDSKSAPPIHTGAGMKVNVIIADPFQLSTEGVDQMEVDAETTGECLRIVAERFPALKKVWYAPDGSPSKYILLSLNDTIVPNNSLDHPVQHGDELFIMLRMVGG